MLLHRYAGWLGTVAARYKVNGKLSDVVPTVEDSRHRLAAVAGTSTCHIVQASARLWSVRLGMLKCRTEP